MIFARMLARDLGRTLDELRQTMSAAEFREHLDDYILEPWGERRADMRAALISQHIVNWSGKSVKKDMPLSAFLLDFDRDEKVVEAEPDPIEHFKRIK